MQTISYRASGVFFLALLSAVFITGNAFAQAPVVSAVAGTGTAGFSGDGGPATSADLNAPSEVTVDSKGNLFIADRNNNRVRKVNAGGDIGPFAGNGVTGYWYLEGGPAASSVLNHPFGAAVDISGNVYIADFGGWSTVGFTNLYIATGDNSGSSRIHRVDVTNGTIHQIQLPVTTSGTLALAVDAPGNLYIAERFGQKIYRLIAQTGAFERIGGTGTAGFSGDGAPGINAQIHNPGYLAVDAAGNVYFSDTLNNRIRKIAAGSDIITTVAGNGTAGFSGDGGAATAAELNNPEGVAVDPEGNVYIADTLNKRIRRVSANTGVITTVITGGQAGDCQGAIAGLQSPGSLAMNAAGDTLFITDDSANRIWQALLHPVTIAPVLKSIAPPSGAPGATVSVTLAGTGFAAGSGGCPNSAFATVSVSGAGVVASNVNIASDTSLTANLAIAPDAALGARTITVSTDGGVSGPVQFNVVVPTAPPPTLASIAPTSVFRGTSITATLAGTNFDTRAGNTNVAADGSGLSVSQISVASATSLTAVFTAAPDAALGPHNVVVTTAGGSSTAVPLNVVPEGPALAFTYGIPPTLNPTDQTPIQVALANAVPNSVTATLTLTFTANANGGATDDPNVTFVNAQTSTRTTTVTFPPNTTNAQLSISDGMLQAGTEAGMIQLSMSGVQVGGAAATASGGDFSVQIPRLPPVITSMRILNRSSKGFDVEITGYSTSREITKATFDFGAASGAKLLTVELEPNVSSSFTDYYQSNASDTAGGAFVYTQPFIASQGDANVVASVTATLTNSLGTSQPKTAP
jgi:sugar lactone lactonase YvrE